MSRITGSALVLCAAVLSASAFANDFETRSNLNLGLTPDPAKGLEILLNEPMGTRVMMEADIDRIWQVWEPDARAEAEAATPDERRKLVFERYGWATREGGYAEAPLDYTPDGDGGLVTNCFACHGGTVAGKTLPGAGNVYVDLTTLATDVSKLEALDNGRDPSLVEDVVAPFKTPLNYHKGTTNAVIFAFVFAGLRDSNLGMKYLQNPDLLLHHDMNPPAWWNYSKKELIYCDAFAPRTPRQLMPFAMSPAFSYEKFQSFEPNFVHIQAYIEALEAPEYPFPIDKDLAAKGKVAFERACAECHGSYGENASFPNKVIDIDRIGTDTRRFESISTERRKAANEGWLQYHGEQPLLTETKGYLAQPLDGIWATAPYLHNGSVPTLYHLFNVDERPAIWKRADGEYDSENVGLVFEAVDTLPDGLTTREQRAYYTTSTPGSGNGGHTFPDEELDAEEKRAVIEYLKTL